MTSSACPSRRSRPPPRRSGNGRRKSDTPGSLSSQLNFVAGGFAFRQALDSNPSFKQEQGAAASRFLLAPSASATPSLLDGYGFDQYFTYRNVSAALFGQLEWSVTDRLRLLPGLRFNYDQKSVDFDQQVYGGLDTTNPAQVALQRSILAPQAYATDVDDTNTSGQVTAAYRFTNTLTPTGRMRPGSSRWASISTVCPRTRWAGPFCPLPP